MEMGLFVVVFFFSGGGAGNLDLMPMVFFAIITSALYVKAGCLTRAIFSAETKIW